MQITRKQSFFLAGGALLLFFFIGVFLTPKTNTTEKEAKPDTSPEAKSVISEQDSSQEPLQQESKFVIGDFHRSETRDGKLVWEVRGSNARYFPEENLIKINNGRLIFFNEDGSQLTVDALEAELEITEGSLTTANTFRETTVHHSGGMTLKTKEATFRKELNRIDAPGKVEIEGGVYLISGMGLEANLETKEFHILADVKTKILPRRKKS